MTEAQKLIPAVQGLHEPIERKHKLIQLIETVVLYQWPHLSRKEVEKMLKVSDIRQTRVYQEALEEGIEQGRELAREETTEAIARRLLDAGITIDKIAKATGLSAAAVRRLKKKNDA
jgi:predicted transposase/invertase (TIGR01784 family)